MGTGRNTSGEYVIEIAIPKNIGQGYGLTGKTVSGLTLREGRKIGINIILANLEGTGWPLDRFTGQKAFLFEPYRFYDVVLKPGNVSSESPAPVPLTEPEFNLTVQKGISFIHLPLKVTSTDDQPKKLQTIGDLYNVLGGSDDVNFLITYNPLEQKWFSYLGNQSRDRAADQILTDDLGIITVMKNPVALLLRGEALGANGTSQIRLNPGTNLVGVPLQDERLQLVSDLLSLPGIENNATAIMVWEAGQFKVIDHTGDDDDVPLTGGQSFIITARALGVAQITGDAWDNVSGSRIAAPPLALVGQTVGERTPVLAVHGVIVTEELAGLSTDRFRITVRNLSTGALLSVVSGSDGSEGGYSVTFVDAISSRAAQVDDVLKVSVETPSPLIDIRPLRYVVTPEDVSESQIRLPNLIAYEIPTDTKLLPNYPNPFNPETWIPYQLASSAEVTIEIYNIRGRLIRRLNLGEQPAGLYLNRENAAYWDGRSDAGELVSSGLYFYQLRADDFTSVKRMVILK
ncbi:T9SS type A sorting domain-containing protein [Candidatus Poribacteria bacterium]|nr:T9SS type A sorting domain-containing protein [Candidatus Poribacteria bacterium]